MTAHGSRSARLRRLRRRARRVGVRVTLPVKRLQLRGMLPLPGMARPDFVIIGAQKAGTTWLAENLDAHAEISLARREPSSDPTEIRYFDQHLHRSLGWYARHFRDLPGRLKGEKSPNYYTLPPERVRLVADVLPDARIVIMLRNPVERAWSHALMNLVTLPGARFEDVPESRFRAHFRRTFARGRYSEALEKWWGAYPRERVRVGFFEDIRERPRELLASMLEGLGAAPETEWERYPFGRRINRGPGIPLPDAFRETLESMYREEIRRLEEWFGEPVARWRAAGS